MSLCNDTPNGAAQFKIPFIVTWNYYSDKECTTLARNFRLYCSQHERSLYLIDVEGTKHEIHITAEPEEIYPFDKNRTLNDLLTARFMAAMTGKTDRVDLRFCTGQPERRQPSFDNLHPDYKPLFP